MLRDLLLKRVRPAVERTANQIVDLLITRVETELALVPEALEVALSAFAFTPEPKHADSDWPDHDPVPTVPSGAGRGLRSDDRRGQGRSDSGDVDGPNEEQPAQEASPRRREGERAPRLVAPADPLKQVLGPVLAGMLAPPQPRPSSDYHTIEHRDTKPENVTSSGKPRQRAVMRCSKCGKLGARADGCGTSHEPEHVLTAIEPSRQVRPTPAAVAHAKNNIARREAIKASAGGLVVKPSRPAQVVDDNANARERWTAEEIAEETERCELLKPDGSMPALSSSWEF